MKIVDQSRCVASFGNNKVNDFVFANDTVIFGELLKVLVLVLLLETSCITVLSLSMKIMRVVRLSNFTHLGSAVHNDGGFCQEATRRIALTYGIMESCNTSLWRCLYLCRQTKSSHP